MADPRDGEIICAQCRTQLNRTDLNCWRCGGKRLNPVSIEMTAMRAAVDSEGISPKEGFAALFGASGAVAAPLGGVQSTRYNRGQQVDDVRAWVDAGCQHKLVHCIHCARFVCALVAGSLMQCSTCRRRNGLAEQECNHIGKAFELPPMGSP
jgi:hypothetical protein